MKKENKKNAAPTAVYSVKTIHNYCVTCLAFQLSYFCVLMYTYVYFSVIMAPGVATADGGDSREVIVYTCRVSKSQLLNINMYCSYITLCQLSSIIFKTPSPPEKMITAKRNPPLVTVSCVRFKLYSVMVCTY